MPTVNEVHSQQYPQTNTNAPVQRQQYPTQSNARYDRTPNADKFTKQNTKTKWYKDPVIGFFIAVPLAMLLFDGIFLKGQHMKSIFSHKTPITKEEKALFGAAKENLKQTEQKVSQYEKEMKEIKAFMEERKKKAEEILKDKKYKETVGTVTYQKDIMGNYLITDTSQNGFKFSIKGLLGLSKDSLGGEYQLERRINGRLNDRIRLQKTISLEQGDKFTRFIYDESGKKSVEHLNAAGGSVISELEGEKLVRQFEKSKTELFGKPTTKYKDMNGKDIVTHSVEKNENEIIIDGKSYDSRSLGSKLWSWIEDTVIDVI